VVDVPAFERVAIPALERAAGHTWPVIIDELGQMELLSDEFVHAARRIFDRNEMVTATVHTRPHPATDEIRARTDVEEIDISHYNREEVFQELLRRIKRKSQ
jgi:nucleoside-triphosphatase